MASLALPDNNPALRAALDYARRGWRVVPIIRGQKRPPFSEWQRKATTDPDTIKRWFRGAAHGVGIATGSGSGIFVLDVDVGEGKNGDETLADLEATYGPLPATREHLTGSGGRHLFFKIPPGVTIRNESAVRLGPGLDIRGEGGQVLAPPTIHPNGTPYTEELSSPDEPADPPDWLIALLTQDTSDKPRVERVPYAGDPRPGDRFAASVTWPQLLEQAGATFLGARQDRNGGTYELWARPGVGDDHAGATLYYGGTDLLKVFTSNWPGLIQGATYTRFGFYAAIWHGGDHSAAARALAARQNEEDIAALLLEPAPEAPQAPAEAPEGDDEPEDEENDWAPVDLEPWLEGTAEEEPPTILPRSDGVCLMYPGRINMLFGESGAGKSWLVLHACATILRDGGSAIYVDLEDHPRSMVARLRQLNVPADAIKQRFFYLRPSTGITTRAINTVQHLVDTAGASLVVLDSLGEAMALFGVKDEDTAVSAFVQSLLRPLSRTGAGVVLLDHIVKNQADAPKLFSIGSQRKRAMIDGASYRVEAIESFNRSRSGRLKLICAKDRLGHHAQGRTVAEAIVTVSGQMTIELRPPAGGEGGEWRPTRLMERVSRHLEGALEPTSQRAIEQAVIGKASAIRAAIKALCADGFVRRERDGFVSIKPYREPVDPVDNYVTDPSASPASPRVPPRPGTRPKGLERPASPASPPLQGDAGRGTRLGQRETGQEDASRRDAPADPEDDDWSIF